jgi:uncharacterized protein (DUF58 family)
MTSLLRRVRTTLSIHAHRRVRGMLDGEYASVFHGRSLEFDDVRPYVAGDEVKDVDWKATARLGTLMTRRYVASRKHTILLVVDAGRNMAATSASGESKRDVAILAAGTAGYIAAHHGDLVGLVTGDSAGTVYLRPSSTEAHLERMLQTVHDRVGLEAAPGDLSEQLDFVARTLKRGPVLVVVADDRPLSPVEERELRRLRVRHEILWITIADADLMSAELAPLGMTDVVAGSALPSALRRDVALRAQFQASVAAAEATATDLFDSLGISRVRVGGASEVVPAFFRLLESHRHARR